MISIRSPATSTTPPSPSPLSVPFWVPASACSSAGTPTSWPRWYELSYCSPSFVAWRWEGPPYAICYIMYVYIYYPILYILISKHINPPKSLVPNSKGRLDSLNVFSAGTSSHLRWQLASPVTTTGEYNAFFQCRNRFKRIRTKIKS